MDDLPVELSKLFDDGFNINEELKESSLPTNSKQFQVCSEQTLYNCWHSLKTSILSLIRIKS